MPQAMMYAPPPQQLGPCPDYLSMLAYQDYPGMMGGGGQGQGGGGSWCPPITPAT